MIFLDSFKLPDNRSEDDFLLRSYKMDMRYYSPDNIHPFRFFSEKGLYHLNFAPITIFYGSNGSGKSTLLNVISETLGLKRSSPFNKTQFLYDYCELCHQYSYSKIPLESRIITSDDVFDFLLDIRSINIGISSKRERLCDEYEVEKMASQSGKTVRMRTFDDLELLKKRNEVNHSTKSAYVSRRLPKELCGKSNGESAFLYFTQEIKDNALYLLDEPENSLSPALQLKLRQFIEDSVRFYGCQFVISTHSPFLLSLKGARIYDLDAIPVTEKKWTELESVRLFHDFFEQHRNDFT